MQTEIIEARGRYHCRTERGRCAHKRRSRPGGGGAVQACGGRTGQIHSQLRPAQWRAGTAAAVLGIHGHHPATDQDGLWHRPGPRGRTRPGAHQGVHCRCRGRSHLAISRTVRPQAAGRPARQGGRQDLRQGRRRRHRHGIFLRHHLRAGAGRQALLRRRAE